jgi:hypothetical protein
MAGTLTISTLSDGTNSTSATNPIIGSAKAWISFNGGSTPTVNGSFNVSSITSSATGLFAINFTNAMPNANYAIAGAISAGNADTQNFAMQYSESTASTASQLNVVVKSAASGNTYRAYNSIVVFSS